ncbi:YbjN domain-containing protein [Corynebacterium riegelii]|uniref:YbjN domain-containing protein n=1 Tax=Corynebacterium riegelii TaxID=156976 RepID=UPI00191E648C|nr:YbjN domain-containing protein [Corynebacterium riegelii]QQU83655.1 YbjN domain-containing protein [Corynebacterium riegelii]
MTHPVPITIEAVADVFRGRDLNFQVEDDKLLSGFENCSIFFALSDDSLVFESIWRGMAPQDLAPQLLFTINNLNQARFAPTLRMLETADGMLATSATRTIDAAEGLTDEQLEVFVISTIQMTLETFAQLEQSLPALVDWTDTHDEHH